MITGRMKLFLTAAVLLCLLGTTAWAAKDDIVLVRNDGYIFHVSGQTLGGLGSTTLGMPISAMGLQANGDIVASRSDGYMYRLNGNDPTLSLLAYSYWGGAMSKLVMQPNGNFAALYGGTTIYGGNGTSVAPTGAYAATGAAVTAFAGLNTSSDLMVAYDNGYVSHLNGTTLNMDTWINWGTVINNVVASSNDKLAFTATSNYTYLANSDGTYGGSYVGFVGPLSDQKFRSDDNLCSVLAGSGKIVVNSGSNLGNQLAEMTLGAPEKIAIRPDGSVVAITTTAGTAFALNSNLVYSGVYYPGFGTVTYMQSQSDGDIVVNNTTGDLYLLDGATLAMKAYVLGTYTGITDMQLQVPEPGSLLALVTGLAGLFGCCLRRRK